MRTTACSQCDNKEVPLNDTITVNGKIYCADCFNAGFQENKDLEGYLVKKNHDPTICASCGQDFGDVALNQLATFPICSDCETTIKNRAFPNWVKAFLAGILVIVVFAFFWNWKYYQAYSEIRTANQCYANADYTNAATLMAAASDKVPEVEEVKTIATFFKGIDLLSKDKSEAAMAEFYNCRGKISDLNVDRFIIEARIGACFDKHDYDGFLAAAKDNLSIDTTQAISWASVASAYACIYAEKGDEEARRQVQRCLEKAKSIDAGSESMKEYYNMIDYRVWSRQIIKREEFIQKFPNGWTKN